MKTYKELVQEDKEDDDLKRTMKIANVKMSFAKKMKSKRKQQKASLDREKDTKKKKAKKKSQDTDLKNLKTNAKNTIKSIQKSK